jgi:hypothetical protein
MPALPSGIEIPMSSPLRPLLLASLAALAAPRHADAESFRCPGGIISEGDYRIDLLGKCGQPALRERWVAEGRVLGPARRHGGGWVETRTVDVVVDQWTYDFGTLAFSYLVTLENGRITRIERLGHGSRQDPPPGPVAPTRGTCDMLSGVHEGDGKLDVLARCGEPAVSDAWNEGGGAVRVEVWTYDLGRSQFIRFVRFENGRVVEITTGNRGYAD